VIVVVHRWVEQELSQWRALSDHPLTHPKRSSVRIRFPVSDYAASLFLCVVMLSFGAFLVFFTGHYALGGIALLAGLALSAVRMRLASASYMPDLCVGVCAGAPLVCTGGPPAVRCAAGLPGVVGRAGARRGPCHAHAAGDRADRPRLPLVRRPRTLSLLIVADRGADCPAMRRNCARYPVPPSAVARCAGPLLPR
jgi:hypothetical protein